MSLTRKEQTMSDEFKITRYIENESPKANKNLVEVVRCRMTMSAMQAVADWCMMQISSVLTEKGADNEADNN